MSRFRTSVAAYFLMAIAVGQCIGFVGCKRPNNVATDQQEPKEQKRPWRDRLVEPKLTAENFTILIAEAIEEAIKEPALEPESVTVQGPLRLLATLPNGEADLYLDNPWQDCHDQTQLRVEIVEQYVAALKQSFERLAANAPPDIERIVPLIRSRQWLQLMEQKGIDVYHEQLVSDLLVVYAEDGPEQLRYVQHEECKAFGISREDMRAIAIRNLKSQLPKIERHGDGPLYMLAAGGTFESSLLLFSNLWEGLEDVADGRIVVATPSRDLLMFTGENATEAVLEMRELAEETHQEGSYVISKTLLIREDGRWIPWTDGESVPILKNAGTLTRL